MSVESLADMLRVNILAYASARRFCCQESVLFGVYFAGSFQRMADRTQ